MPEPVQTPFTSLEEANAEISRLSALLDDTTLQLDQVRIQANTLTEQNSQFQVALIKARTSASRIIAMAGVSPLEESGVISLAEDQTQNLVGLKRAIAANTARSRSPREKGEEY